MQARWYSFHFLVQQLVGSLVRLRISLNLALPLLPGADIRKASGCTDSPFYEARKTYGQDTASDRVTDQERKQAAIQVAVE